MWHALRAELAYFRPWLLGGLGIAAGVVILLSVLLRLFGEGEDIPSFLPGMFPVLAGMVVSFIAQSYRFEERRFRMLMAAPLSPRQLAGVMVLLPGVLVLLGALAAVPMLGLAAVMGTQVEFSSARMLGVLAGQFFVMAQMGPLIQEAVVAQKQGRGRAAIAAWVGLMVSLPVLFSFYWLEGYPAIHVPAHLAVAAVIMVASVTLYQNRTDFTA